MDAEFSQPQGNMDSYYIKRWFIVSFCLSIFLFYLLKRLQSIRHALRQEIRWEECERSTFGNRNLFEARARWKDNLPATITYSTHESIESQAELLYNSGYNHTNLHTLKHINICDGINCKTMDMRLFLHEYFTEIVQGGELVNEDSNGMYYFRRNNEFGASDMQFRYEVLGAMYILALLTEAYIEINFLNLAWIRTSEAAYYQHELEYIDKSAFYDFSRLQRTGRIVDSDTEKYLIRPFERAREAVFEGSQRFFGESNHNTITIRPAKFDQFKPKTFLLLWRDHSICKTSCNNFWRAISKLNIDEMFQIYQKISGYGTFPSGGFYYLPKTLLVNEPTVDEMFPERFKINLRKEFTIDEIYNILKTLLHSNS